MKDERHTPYNHIERFLVEKIRTTKGLPGFTELKSSVKPKDNLLSHN